MPAIVDFQSVWIGFVGLRSDYLLLTSISLYRSQQLPISRLLHHLFTRFEFRCAGAMLCVPVHLFAFDMQLLACTHSAVHTSTAHNKHQSNPKRSFENKDPAHSHTNGKRDEARGDRKRKRTQCIKRMYLQMHSLTRLHE